MSHEVVVLLHFDSSIERVVLNRQDPISGLLPASTTTVHGNYGDAWVRDCVYSIPCVWALAIAHRRRFGERCSRAWELEERVLALMRGLLRAMMRQAAKVERFKHSLDPLDALHAKYDSHSGDPVVADTAWGHRPLAATSVFLLQRAQLTRGGLPVVRSRDEADFLQNLVHYISRAYRTRDYGIWERGDKANHGQPERNASSIGVAKAALEAGDLDLFGPHGDGGVRLLIPKGGRPAETGPGKPAAEGIRQQGSRQCLSVGDRLSSLGCGGCGADRTRSSASGVTWAAPTATSASCGMVINRDRGRQPSPLRTRGTDAFCRD